MSARACLCSPQVRAVSHRLRRLLELEARAGAGFAIAYPASLGERHEGSRERLDGSIRVPAWVMLKPRALRKS